MDVVPTFGSFWPRSRGLAGLALSVPNGLPQRSAFRNRATHSAGTFRSQAEEARDFDHADPREYTRFPAPGHRVCANPAL